MSRITYIEEQSRAITSLLDTTPREDILNNQWVLSGLKYALQTAVEAMIDIAYHLSAKVYRHPPADARDAFTELVKGGTLDSSDLPTYLAMVGFRNRVVHGYLRIDPDKKVYEIARTSRGDFTKFIKRVKQFAASKGERET
ncbi:MAG TPA: DUF86 domain-containing protein [Firmicutes bacterium]|nr:DUF86 domain-containing protein [Bacillota bacterium]